MSSLKGRVAIITGASRGIGRAIALGLARSGCDIVIAAKSTASSERLPGSIFTVAEEVERLGVGALPVQVDVRDGEQIDAMVKQAIERFGRVDVLINNAGALWWQPVLETPAKRFDLVMGVNARAAFLACRAVLPHMIRQGGGSIINVASTVGAHDACANAVAYVTSKGGVTLFTKAVAIDHAKQGVRVNALVPGATDTPMIRKALTPEALDALAASHPIGRLGRPEELAKAVLFLASDDASFVTGTAMYVDGGQAAKI